MPIVSQESCRSSYGVSKITDNMICAGEAEKDSCQVLIHMRKPFVCSLTQFGILLKQMAWGHIWVRSHVPFTALEITFIGQKGIICHRQRFFMLFFVYFYVSMQIRVHLNRLLHIFYHKKHKGHYAVDSHSISIQNGNLLNTFLGRLWRPSSCLWRKQLWSTGRRFLGLRLRGTRLSGSLCQGHRYKVLSNWFQMVLPFKIQILFLLLSSKALLDSRGDGDRGRRLQQRLKEV